ncbi:hypothetical protein [Terrarubrum flagellatum]|uniref:hypothetical protein n=1 Tax=Terrirubrum flagellatum TaxID=2895980 RepID=UPI0031451DFB
MLLEGGVESHTLAQTTLSALSADYIVGQDRDGRWLAMERNGRAGGLFVTREAALQFAESETGHRPDSVRVVSEIIQLSL